MALVLNVNGARREVAATSEEAALKRRLLNEQLASGQLTAYVVLPKEALKQEHFPYFAKNVGENSVHGSDSQENARIEIAQFFTDDQIVG